MAVYYGSLVDCPRCSRKEPCRSRVSAFSRYPIVDQFRTGADRPADELERLSVTGDP